MTCNEAIVPVNEHKQDLLLPPAEREFDASRDSLLKPPDWRYQEALSYLRNNRDGEPSQIPTDPVVQYTIRGLRCLRINTNKQAPSLNNACRHGLTALMRKSMPALYEALVYGLYRRRSAVASMLDACLIKGWDHTDARKAGCPVSRDVYALYAKIFFDLTGIRAVHCWIHDFLFEPERGSSSKALLRARLLAYYGSGSIGVSGGVTGLLSDAEAALMRAIMSNERQKKLFDYVVSKTALPADVYATMMEAALKEVSGHEFQERMREREESGTESLEELASHMEEGIRAFTKSDVAADATGLDFVNQYTKSLARSDQNGEENVQ